MFSCQPGVEISVTASGLKVGLTLPLQSCRDVVARPILLVASAGEIVDLTG